MPRIEGKITKQGPLIDVKIGLPRSRVEALKRAGQTYARPKTILILVDTGASHSSIDKLVIADLGLSKRGVALIHTPSTGDAYVSLDEYDAELVIGEGHPVFLVIKRPVIESEYASRGFLGLIGRDVLESFTLIYDGPASTFALEWKDNTPPPGVQSPEPVGPRPRERRPKK